MPENYQPKGSVWKVSISENKEVQIEAIVKNNDLAI